MAHKEWEYFNCYKVLRIPADATPQEINDAYKKASRKAHPDMGGSHEAQIKINKAKEILSDPLDRHSHDVYWNVNTRMHARTGSASSRTKDTTKQKSQYTSQKPRPSTPPRNTQKAYKKHTHSNQSFRPLQGLEDRIREAINVETASIWRTLDKKEKNFETKISNIFRDKREEMLYTFLGLVGAIMFVRSLPILWFLVLILGFRLLGALGGVNISGITISILDMTAYAKIKTYAKQAAKEACNSEVKSLQRHIGVLSRIIELISRESTFDNSEEQVARRLVTAFFLLGYSPISYDREYRMMIFTDGEEKMLVRFRHRSGRSTNITYVKKIVSVMQSRSIRRGFLFCSPGLSGNAADFSKRNFVNWYTLETMNSWINGVVNSNYRGPSGNILNELDRLDSFIKELAPKISRRGANYSRRRRY